MLLAMGALVESSDTQDIDRARKAILKWARHACDRILDLIIEVRTVRIISDAVRYDWIHHTIAADQAE